MIDSILKSLLGSDSVANLSQKTGINQSEIPNLIKNLAPKILENSSLSGINSDEISSNGIKEDLLNQILGGKKENLAQEASANSNASTSSISSLISEFAPMLLGSLKGGQSGSSLSNLARNFLDKDGDGQIADDLFDMAKGFFKK